MAGILRVLLSNRAGFFTITRVAFFQALAVGKFKLCCKAGLWGFHTRRDCPQERSYLRFCETEFTTRFCSSSWHAFRFSTAAPFGLKRAERRISRLPLSNLPSMAETFSPRLKLTERFPTLRKSRPPLAYSLEL